MRLLSWTGAILSIQLSSSFVQAVPQLYGVNYGLRKGPDWAPWEARCKTYDQAYAELAQLQQSQITNNVRILSLVDCNDGAVVLQATQALNNMGIWLGLWVGPNSSVFDAERTKLLELMQQFDFSNVLGIHVSSEAMYRGEITSQEAIRLRNIIKDDLVNSGKPNLANIPITIADIEESLSADIDLITVDDTTVTINMFPFWERCCIDINGDTPSNVPINYASAAEYFKERMEFVERMAGSRQIIISETGWADAGTDEAANNANPASMAKWMRDFVCLANERNWNYFWFNAYDDSWRRIQAEDEYTVEGHFGKLSRKRTNWGSKSLSGGASTT
jgi:glucan 1,3-beta-glucosidase